MPTPDESPELAAAYAQLDEAIRTIADARGYMVPGEQITSWLLVGHTQRIDEADGDIRESYLTLYNGGQMSPHVALGLLAAGRALTTESLLDDDD